jgi:hypothetical protein
MNEHGEREVFGALHEYFIKSCFVLRDGRSSREHAPRHFAFEAITTIERCEGTLVAGRASFVLRPIQGGCRTDTTTTLVNLTPR